MSELVEYRLNNASEAEIIEHLLGCDGDFVPPLSGRVDIGHYGQKIASKATRFEAWSNGMLVGLVAAYCDDQEKRIAYVTSVSVLRARAGEGIAGHLLKQCIEHAKSLGMRQLSLDVGNDNVPAIRLYQRNCFVAVNANATFVTMNLRFESGKMHDQ